MTSEPNKRSIYLFVIACFFLSGAAGLIYQILWIRMVDKVTGSSPYAVASVLTVFMAGLGAGSYLAGRLLKKIETKKGLLFAYGLMEAAIGIYGLLSPLLIKLPIPFYRWAYNGIFDMFWLYQILGLFGCGVVLFLPVALMGATLPILCRFYVSDLGVLGEKAGRLYGINTVGASVGAILAGFILIPYLGLWGSLFAAAAVNLSVGFGCVYYAGGISENTPGSSRDSICKENTAENIRGACSPFQERLRICALVIFAVSGFCSMAYEVIWTRLLALLMGPTTYSFTIVVSTFILGLAAGSMVFGRIADRVKDPFSLLVLTQMLAAVFSAVISQFLGGGQFFFAKIIYALKDGFGLLMLTQSLVLFLALLLPTLLLGAAFPLVNKIYTRTIQGLGRSVGTAYAINTVGAILGSCLAGFVIIPFLGKENGLRLLTGLQFFSAMAGGLAFVNWGGIKGLRWPAAALCAVAGIVIFAQLPTWNRMLLSYGRYRDFRSLEGDFLRTSWAEALFKGTDILMRHERGRKLVFYGDGAGGFTTVERLTDSLGTERYTLLNSGKPDASSHGDRSTQTLLAHVPMLFHPGAKDVMVLGLASGMTAGEVLLYPIKRLDVVEISEEVVEACRIFSQWNNKCLDNPLSSVIIQDGRNHLALTSKVYDVIVSEPSNPWMAGLANLYSKEFFETVKDRLGEKGVFVQWIHSYEMDWPTFSMVGRTFASVFPESLMLATLTGVGDYLLVGFKDRRKLDLEGASERLEFAGKSVNMFLPDARLIYHLIVSEDLGNLFGEGPVHTDNRPRLEFAAPRMLHKKGEEIDENIRAGRSLSRETKEILESGDRQSLAMDMMTFSASVLSPLFGLFNHEGALPEERVRFLDLVDDYCGKNLVNDYGIFPDLGSRTRCAGTQAELISKQASIRPEDPDVFFSLGIALREAGERDGAMDAFNKAASLDQFHSKARNSMGVEHLIAGDITKAEKMFQEALRIHPGYATAFFNLAQVSLRRGEKGEAVSYLRRGLFFEDNAAAKDLLRRLLLS